MTFQNWLVSSDLIINSSTWPLPRFSLDLSFSALTGTVLVSSWIGGEHEGWGGVLDSGHLTPIDPTSTFPFFTLNAPLTNWFVYIDLLVGESYPERDGLLHPVYKPPLCTATLAQGPRGLGPNKVERKGKKGSGRFLLKAPSTSLCRQVCVGGTSAPFTNLLSILSLYPVWLHWERLVLGPERLIYHQTLWDSSVGQILCALNLHCCYFIFLGLTPQTQEATGTL